MDQPGGQEIRVSIVYKEGSKIYQINAWPDKKVKELALEFEQLHEHQGKMPVFSKNEITLDENKTFAQLEIKTGDELVMKFKRIGA